MYERHLANHSLNPMPFPWKFKQGPTLKITAYNYIIGYTEILDNLFFCSGPNFVAIHQPAKLNPSKRLR